jgi:hypothetical protein
MNTETKTECPILAKIREGVTEYSDAKLHDQWDDCLDNTTDIVRVGSLEYAPSAVLKAEDPTAYRCGFVDWLDGERERLVEIEGAYYDRAEVESLLDGMEEEVETELEQLREIEEEAEKDNEELPEDHDADKAKTKQDLAAIRAFRRLHL